MKMLNRSIDYEFHITNNCHILSFIPYCLINSSKLKLEKYNIFAKILSYILFYKLSFSFSTISTKYCPLSLCRKQNKFYRGIMVLRKRIPQNPE